VPSPRTPVAEQLPAPAVVAVQPTSPAAAPVVDRTTAVPLPPLLGAPRRRPAVFLAAALVGALGVGLFGAQTSAAEARGAGSPEHAISVAHALGLTSKNSALSQPDATRELSLLAASRAQRQAQQTAAVQAQTAADQAAIEAARPKAVLPVNGAVLTTCFCMRWGTMHWGIDLAAPMGTPEYAVMDGVVLKAGPASGFGQAVYIQHANGDVTVYGHMEKILVTTGQVVHAGDTIALLGAEGEATGPHLHLEVHVGGIEGQKIDPIPWLRERGVQI
jgi:murein DD-endopeptidase MepM/ murein hydrolase activator NlpD